MHGLRTLLLTLVALGLPASVAFGPTASAEAPDDVVSNETKQADILSEEDWLVRTARIEGAAANVREAAVDLKRTADAIGQAGRMTELARLRGEATQLEKRVIGLKLAAEVLGESIGR